MLNILGDLLFIVMIVDLFASKEMRGKKVGWYSISILVFFLFFTAWSKISGNSTTVLLLALRQNKNILLCLYIAVNKSKDEIFIYKTLSFMLYLSIPLSIYQRISSTDSTGDEVGGMFGYNASGILSMLILFYVFSELYNRIKKGDNIFGWYWLTLLPTLINETKIVLFLFPLLLLIILGISKNLTVKIVAFSLVIVVSYANISEKVYKYAYKSYVSDDRKLIMSYDEIVAYFTADHDNQEADLGRINRLTVVYYYLQNQPLYHYLLGYGTGGSFVGIYSGTYGVFAQNISEKRVNVGSRIQLYLFLVEYGLLGTVLFISWILLTMLHCMRKKQIETIDVKAILIITIILSTLIYQQFLLTPSISFIFFYYVFLSQESSFKRLGIIEI